MSLSKKWRPKVNLSRNQNFSSGRSLLVECCQILIIIMVIILLIKSYYTECYIILKLDIHTNLNYFFNRKKKLVATSEVE